MRMQGLFDPYKLYPKDRAMDNEAVFNPYSSPPTDIGTIKQGTVYSAPNIQQPMQQPQMSPQMQQSPMQQQSNDFDAEAEINRIFSNLYTPSNQASDRLNRMIDYQPQRPTDMSKWRKFGGLLVGMGQGPEAQEKAMYAPYYRQMADWKAGLDPAIKAGELERYSNANERQLAYQSATAITREKAEQRRLEKSHADIDRDKKKNQLNEFKTMHPDWDIKQGDNGNLWLVPPRPDLGQPYDTGLLSGDFTDQEKALETEKQIKMRNDAAERRARISSGPKAGKVYTEDEFGHRQIWSWDPNEPDPTKAMKPAVMESPSMQVIPPGYQIANAPGMTEPQRQDAIEERAARAMSSHPEWPKNAIIKGPTGLPIINPRIKDEALRRQIMGEIYGSQPSAANRNRPENVPPQGAKPGGKYRSIPNMPGVYEVEVP